MSARSGCGCSRRVVPYFALALALLRAMHQAVRAKLVARCGATA
ncbi:hypothetical protein [Streptomyces sp. NPDC002078]